MQGKGVVKFFAIILAIVCIYQLSFTWVAKKVENDARIFAKGDTAKEKIYLDSVATLPAYPLIGHSYQYCLERELALGLDLKGGMNVTMQISLAELKSWFTSAPASSPAPGSRRRTPRSAARPRRCRARPHSATRSR